MYRPSIVYFFLFLTLVARSWAEEYQSILTQISAGSNDCKKSGLLEGFDLKSVSQFNALCNIPVPDIHQSEFLIQNNVVPILCMGLMDVTLRLCKSAKNDISPFKDIFPPSPTKFSEIFTKLSQSNDFSSLDEFCSTTVNKFAIQEAASNLTELWWQVLNRQLSDAKLCSNICHSNDGSKVHPLCSFILWSNGVYKNYKKNEVDNQQFTSGGGDKTLAVTVAKDTDPVNQGGKDNQIASYGKSEPSTNPSEPIIDPDAAHVTDDETKIISQTKPNIVTDNNNVGVGTVEQLVNKGDEVVVTNMVKADINMSTDVGKPFKKDEKIKTIHQIKDPATTSNPGGSLNAVEGAKVQGKTVSSIGQVEDKDGPVMSGVAGAMSPNVSGAQGPVLPEPEPGKAAEGMVEGDFSLEVTPEGVGLDQPIAADKEFQLPYTDEEGEDGDGDDVDIVESNVQAATNNNNSSPVASKQSNKGSAGSIQQGPLEGDKVYGEGEIVIEDHFIEAEDSHFFTYFLCMAVLTIMAYLAFHNKKKLIALAVEGRRTKGGRRRPNSSQYSKLDCSLEEALVSNTTATVTHVLY